MSRPIRIPGEIQSRFDDVAFECPERWEQCSQEQKDRAIEEALHLIDLIEGGGSIYESFGRFGIISSCRAFLKRTCPNT